MLDIFRGQRPDVTPAQVAAVFVAGVPAIATLLSAFGVANVTQAQQDSLAGVLTWCAILAGVLIGGDATLRTARNVVDGKRDAAAMLAAPAGDPPPSAGAAGSHDPEVDDAEHTVVVADDEEFAGDDATGSVNGHGGFDDPDLVTVDK